MFNKFTIFNRPISPHLLIYSPQISSLLSIWHRISGIILVSLITGILISFKTFSNSLSFSLIYGINNLLPWLSKFFYEFSLLFLLYHILNGICHIIWDLGFFPNSKLLVYSSLVFIIFIFLILFLNVVNF